METNLITTNIWKGAKLPTIIYFIIYLISNLISSTLNKEDLVALVHLISYNLPNTIKSILQIVHKLRHKVTINIVLESIVWKWKLMISQLWSSIVHFHSFVFYKTDEFRILSIFINITTILRIRLLVEVEKESKLK